jgi:hypothetical protein
MKNADKTQGAIGVILLFCLLLIGVLPGCISVLASLPPAVQVGIGKTHFVEGQPVISVTPLVNRNNEVLGAIVQVASYEAVSGEMNSPHSNGTSRRSAVAVDSGGVNLIADGQSTSLNAQELAGGPWIYYLNEDEPFRKIPVHTTQVKQFKTSLEKQPPLEFIAQWCHQKAGRPILRR